MSLTHKCANEKVLWMHTCMGVCEDDAGTCIRSLGRDQNWSDAQNPRQAERVSYFIINKPVPPNKHCAHTNNRHMYPNTLANKIYLKKKTYNLKISRGAPQIL